ncbi:MAG: glycosyltransferase family 2 protein [Vicinamibacterales bacterium]
MPTASIVIATYNRASFLDACLTCLAAQAFEAGDEVLVADNGSTDRTAEVAARHAATFPVPLVRIHEGRPGKSHALASALASASGDIAVFTDDDVEVDTGWLDALRSALSDPGVDMAGGPVEPHWERTPPFWLRLDPNGYGRLAAPLGLLDYGPAEQPLGGRTLLGANMAVRRSVLDAAGGFAAHLGKLRGTLLSGEDHELCQRIQAAGSVVRYSPEARVRHWVPADRMRLAYFLRWFYWSGITNAAIDAGSRSARTVLGVPPFLVRQFTRGVCGAAVSALRGRFATAVDRALDSAFAVGYAARMSGLAARGAGTPGRQQLARGL